MNVHLDEETDKEAKSFLMFLKNRCFAPIIIYTDKGVESPRYYLEQEKLDRIGTVLDKYEVKGERVIEEVKNWINENIELKILLKWASEIERKINDVLWTVHDLEVGGIRALIDLLQHPPGESHLPLEKDLTSFF